MRRVNTLIGSPVERVEDLRFVQGRGQFVADLTRPGQWHAAMVRSPVAHGRIRAIDASAALALPGVRAVLTARDIGTPIPLIPFRRPNPTIAPYAQPVIAAEIVRYVGEPVAMVLADNAGLAEDAVQAVALDLEPLPPVVDHRASAKGDVLLIAGTASNCASVFTAVTGNVGWPRDPGRWRGNHSRAAWRHLMRHRRLCAAERHDAGAQCRAVPHRALPGPPSRPHRACDDDQQDAVGHLSRAGPLRGLLL